MNIQLEESPRPAGDENKAFAAMIGGALRDRKEAFELGEFVECDACAAKPGHPALCIGCLANRETIRVLQKSAKQKRRIK